MDQVVVALEMGEHALICRMTDCKGSYIAFKEAKEKLFPNTPKQSLINELKRQAAKLDIISTASRDATDEEKSLLRVHGAIKARSKVVKLYTLPLIHETSKSLKDVHHDLKSSLAKLVNSPDDSPTSKKMLSASTAPEASIAIAGTFLTEYSVSINACTKHA